jgi:RNA polymerase sigma-70 factor (ECF subfamily)
MQDDLQAESETFEQFDGRSSLDAISSAETSQRVRDAVNKLPADMREAIELAFFGSLKQSEIAERLNAPLGTIKARIRRGMTKLQNMLDSDV